MSSATETYRYSKLRIKRFNASVDAAVVGRSVYFKVKSLCKAVGGLAPQPQIERLRADGRTAPHLRPIPMPTVKGTRPAVCIRRQEVSIWLAMVDIPRTAMKDKSLLQQFQNELFAAADRFLMGDLSDVEMDGPVTTRPVSGKLAVGDCPRCGMRLCISFDDGPAHLIPDPEEEDDDDEED